MIVKAAYYKPEFKSYGSRGYTYRTELDLRAGDKVIAPTAYGEQKAIITETNLPESVIDPKWADSVKSITQMDIGGDEA